jgi:hypothetical protein
MGRRVDDTTFVVFVMGSTLVIEDPLPDKSGESVALGPRGSSSQAVRVPDPETRFPLNGDMRRWGDDHPR